MNVFCNLYIIMCIYIDLERYEYGNLAKVMFVLFYNSQGVML
jgi:hypothetical protein